MISHLVAISCHMNFEKKRDEAMKGTCFLTVHQSRREKNHLEQRSVFDTQKLSVPSSQRR